MKVYYKKVAVILAMALCIGTLTGCAHENTEVSKTESKPTVSVSKMEKEDSRGLSFGFIGGKDVMPIGGFYGPYSPTYSKNGNRVPSTITEEVFQKLSDAGINLIVGSDLYYRRDPEGVIKCLELGEKYGIGLFVSDENVTKGYSNTNYTKEAAQDALVEYYDYDSFVGHHLVDEPSTSYYGNSVAWNEMWRWVHLANILENELGVTCYTNLYPVGASTADKTNYKKYIEEFCETMNPKFISWDHYIFDLARGKNYSMYFWNLDVVRQYSEKYNIPFWSFVQAGSYWGELTTDTKEYLVNEAEFDWNVNTALAFGAQGIQYFPLIQPYHFAYAQSTDYDLQRNSILGAWGNTTQYYHYAKNINKQIAAIDHVLMNSVNKGVIVSGENAKKDTQEATCIVNSGQFQELMSVTGDAMVGCFNYNGNTALYVVNYSMEYAQNIQLELNDTHKITVIQNAKESHVKADTLTLDMAAGEGVLLVIE